MVYNNWKNKDKIKKQLEGGNAHIAYSHFINEGFTHEQAAGIVGNLAQESGLNLNTKAIGDGGNALGIAQWNDRRKNLIKFAQDNNLEVTDLNTQLKFITHELNTTERKAFKLLKNTSTIKEATSIFSEHFERPGTPHLQNRINYATQFFNEFSGKPIINLSNNYQGVNQEENISPYPIFNLESSPNVDMLNYIKDLNDNYSKVEEEKNNLIRESVYKKKLQDNIDKRNFLEEFINNTNIDYVERLPNTIPTV